MRLIPGRTKVKVELFKGVSIADMVIGAVFALLIVFVLTSSLPGKLYIAIGLLILAVALLARMDAEPNYQYLLHILRHFGYRRNFSRLYSDEMLLRSNEAGASSSRFEMLLPRIPSYALATLLFLLIAVNACETFASSRNWWPTVRFRLRARLLPIWI